MPISFKGAPFPKEIILTCVRWYVAYPLSTRNLEAMMRERQVQTLFFSAAPASPCNQIAGRVQLTDIERKELAELGATLGKKALEEITTVAQPDTILAWKRKFADGRVRRWVRIAEANNKYLRVILLEDRETVHNAFFDRSFDEEV